MKSATLLILANVFLAGVTAYSSVSQLTEDLQNIMSDASLKPARDNHMSNWRNWNKKTDVNYGVANYTCGNLTTTSNSTPTTVHALRPGDIKVVAAMGDSLTAGQGAGASSLMEVMLEYRGLAFSIGGDGDLGYMTTLPNVLKSFDASLIGASTGVGPVWLESRSRLNVANGGATASDMSSQAWALIRRIRNDQTIDFDNDWKLVTIFVGANDLCGYCQNKYSYSPSSWGQNMKKALDILHEALPRTLVNVVNIFHIELLRQTHKSSFFCSIMHRSECSCATSRFFGSSDLNSVVKQYQQVLTSLETSGYYDLREDFTVVVQNFLENAHLATENGTVDLGLFAPDCYHFSQLGHARVAAGLWNNMLEAVGNKSDAFNPNQKEIELSCPDEACPFIRTGKNSLNCSLYLPSENETAEATTAFPEPFTWPHPPHFTWEPPENTTLPFWFKPYFRNRTHHNNSWWIDWLKNHTSFDGAQSPEDRPFQELLQLEEGKKNDAFSVQMKQQPEASGSSASSPIIVLGLVVGLVAVLLAASIIYKVKRRRGVERIENRPGFLDQIAGPSVPVDESTPLLKDEAKQDSTEMVKVY